MNIWKIGAVISALATAAPAWAADTTPCAKGMICASAPKTIADAMKAAGLKAELAKEDDGTPFIKSEASGYNYSVFLMDCTEAKTGCAAMLLETSFSKSDGHTVAMANKWNRDKRMAKMWVAEDKALYLQYDLGTVGGLNQTQFKDTILWWNEVMADLGTFFDENL